jgi:hypothetical protein
MPGLIREMEKVMTATCINVRLVKGVIEGQNFTFILEIITLSVHLLLPISRLLPFVIALEILSSLISKLEKPELFHFFLVLNLQHNACSFLVWRSL